MSRRSGFAPPRRMAGVSLVELMVSLILGLMVVGAALTVFISNRQTYAATESLGRIQETARIAFEVMARDVREAGGMPCDLDAPIVNVLNSPATAWWSMWTTPLSGYEATTAAAGLPFGTGAGQRLSGTDAIELHSAHSNGVTVADHQSASARFSVNKVDHGLQDGDIAMVCDFDHAAIFQVTNAQSGTNNNIVHNTGAQTPGNATTCLSLDGNCPNVPGGGGARTYSFGCFNGARRNNGTCVDPRPWPGTIARLEAARWYVGNNGRGGRSLYRAALRNVDGSLTADPIEIAENVQDLQLRYLVGSGNTATYVDASVVTNWSNVSAVRVRLTLTGTVAVGTDGAPLTRWMQHTIALRNRT